MSVTCDFSQVYDIDYKTTLLDLDVGGCMPVKIIKPQSYGPHPVVVLLMGMSGVDASLCSVGRLVAEEGYAVAIPDLYHDTGIKAGASLADLDHALESMHLISDQKAVDDIGATLEFVIGRRDMDSSRISLLGHCLGGRLCLLAGSCFPEKVRCIASYYASGLETCFSSFKNLTAPTQLVTAGKSLFALPDAFDRVEASLRKNNNFVERISYEDARHNFLDARDRYYNPVQAADALYKTFDFIADNCAVA